ncbi:hypothetical protein G6F35_018707 [Rhizopus arrhizus]|nr:hypothetical protein G6F35_018707 [Rhizopus arrhizus]
MATARPRPADAHQGVVHAPHRAEQADERSGRTHRRQHRQAVFQLGGFFVDDLAHGARDEIGIAARLFQLGRAELVVVRLRVHGEIGSAHV